MYLIESIRGMLQKEETTETYKYLECICEELESAMNTGKFSENFVEYVMTAETVSQKCSEGEMCAAVYTRNVVEQGVFNLLRTELMYDGYFMYLLWFLVKCFKRAAYLELFCDVVLGREDMSPMQYRFVLHQIKALLIRCPQMETDQVSNYIEQMQEIIRKYYAMTFSVCRRSKEERNAGTAIVMTANFLGENHPVSKSALERCYALKKELGMRVILLSLGEDLGQEGGVILYHSERRNHMKQYCECKQYVYQSEELEFYQPRVPVDTTEGTRAALAYIQEINPEFVVYVGEQGFFAELVNGFCPVLSVSTTFSALQRTNTEFVMVGRQVTEEEKEKSFAEVLETKFTFQLKGKKRDYTRADLGLPRDKFVLAVVGMRLDADVSEEFLYAMRPLMERDCVLLFIGKYDSYCQQCERFPWLGTGAVMLGICDDVTGVLTCADLYVNPHRLGGGFSVAEAFDAGIPAVTTRYGDVPVAAGEAFCVNDYFEMAALIDRYQNDKDFYQEQLTKAKLRLRELTTGKSPFVDAILKMQMSSRFY